jgi:hypothetical protein
MIFWTSVTKYHRSFFNHSSSAFFFLAWPELKDFVTALREYRALRLVPREALLTKSYGDSVLFKSLRPQDATPTSFSDYEEYGIDLGLRDNYYTLPKRELSIEEVFIHSLDSAESLQQRLFCILFYLKNRDKLEGVDHPMMKDIRAVLQGERIKGYPSFEEGIARLDDQGLSIPIGDKISLLAFEYNEKLWKDSPKPGIQD